MTYANHTRSLGLLLGLVAATAARGASLQASPVMLELTPPAASGVINLENTGDRPINAQVRVFRWRLVDGAEQLEPTESVVASPPTAELVSKQSYAVRVLRTDDAPVTEPEYYRVIVDELPGPQDQRPNAVTMAMRYSIPVFVEPPGGASPQLSWGWRKEGGNVVVTLRNDGDRRVRISALTLKGKGSVSFGAGLVGYALAHSEAKWSRPAKGFQGGAVKVTAQSDVGPIDAEAVEQR
ncbi:fimbrial biogenesis chaperone [Methylocystis echinoides]|uniref:Pilus assembly protein n=1 Tax=Methylocystis echinoides TaxID=29468 RepID=A0A9W6GY28_9HYPH|nr:molecular chaperone [Methylocystis echinoides]GLI95041.1 pilus assembly protein [Methylocystis echinoides]